MGSRFLPPLLFTLVLACLIGCSGTSQQSHDYSLYLIRHAEKQADGSKDPDLTAAGEQRAQQLANWFKDKNIADVWSSDYHRTRNTATPSLTQGGLELRLYDPRDLPAIASELRQNHHNAIIVGHSNTTPQLAGLLCDCDVDEMDETEYDLLFVVSVNGDEATLEILNQKGLFQTSER